LGGAREDLGIFEAAHGAGLRDTAQRVPKDDALELLNAAIYLVAIKRDWQLSGCNAAEAKT
jgi:hypothetical protein